MQPEKERTKREWKSEGKRVLEGGRFVHSRGWQRGFNSAMADVSDCEMQRPSASFDFIHRRRDEWKSNEWHPASLDIVRSNSRYEVRETAGRRRGCHSRSRACAQTERQEVYKNGLRVILLISPER